MLAVGCLYRLAVVVRADTTAALVSLALLAGLSTSMLLLDRSRLRLHRLLGPLHRLLGMEPLASLKRMQLTRKCLAKQFQVSCHDE